MARRRSLVTYHVRKCISTHRHSERTKDPDRGWVRFFFSLMLRRCFHIEQQCINWMSVRHPSKIKVPLGPEFWIPYFCIFENSLWLLVTMPNFNSLRWLEVAFFGRFLSRFYDRHYWPLFRKLACELAEVTLEAHLKPSQASFDYLPREM